MLPKFTALFEAHDRLCRSRGIRYTQDDLYDAQIGIARARLLAAKLAGDREEDEPAALLFALLLEADALRSLRDAFPAAVVRYFVRSRGLDLPLDLEDRIELRTLRDSGPGGMGSPPIVTGFERVRAFVAARLRPLER